MCLTNNILMYWKSSCRKIIAAALLGVCFGSQASDEKTITVNPDPGPGSLEFSFVPARPSFNLSEPLQFTLLANQDVFLYVYTVNQDGTYALILPNQAQAGNKYPADTPMTVPNKNIAFMADGKAAEEPVYAIASTRYIDLELAKQKQAGDFVILEPDDMRKRFGAKGIVIRDLEVAVVEGQVAVENSVVGSTASALVNQSGQQSTATSPTSPPAMIAEALLVRVNVPITNTALTEDAGNEQQDSEVNVEPIMTFVATDRTSYREGDTVHILFGASKPGAVALYFIDPDGSGSDTPITTRDVDGSAFVKVSATHHGSRGSHMIRAEYIPPAGDNKSLSLNDDKKLPATSAISFDVTE